MRPGAILALALTVATIASAFAAERVPARKWRKVKTYDMQTLQKMEPIRMRRIVGVRFSYRSKDIRHLKPNWFYSSIWSYRRDGGREHFDHIPVMVAKADLEAFKAIPGDLQEGGSHLVYGQVLEDNEARFLFLRLLGTKVKRDKRGNAVVRW